MTLQELLNKCKDNINSEVAFQEIVAEHDKQIRNESYDQALEDLIDETLNVISNNYSHPYLGDAIYELVNDALVDAIRQLKK